MHDSKPSWAGLQLPGGNCIDSLLSASYQLFSDTSFRNTTCVWYLLYRIPLPHKECPPCPPSPWPCPCAWPGRWWWPGPGGSSPCPWPWTPGTWPPGRPGTWPAPPTHRCWSWLVEGGRIESDWTPLGSLPLFMVVSLVSVGALGIKDRFWRKVGEKLR